MTVYSLRSTIVAAVLTLGLLVFFAVQGRFGSAAGPAALTAVAYAGLILAALLVAHLICGVLIGSRIAEDRRIGTLAILIMSVVYAGFVLLSIGIAGRFGIGGHLPDFGGVRACAMMLAWLAWMIVWRAELRARM